MSDLEELDRMIRKYQFAIDHETIDNAFPESRKKFLRREKSKMEMMRRIKVNSIRRELEKMLNEG